MAPHDFLFRLLMGAERGAFEAATVADVVICHDSWCGIHHGAACDCEPVITLQANSRRLELLADGTVRDLGACQ